MGHRVSLVNELRRVFHASGEAIRCAISHGQITVDGYVVSLEHDKRWTRAQLGGRMAKLHQREARLFGMSQRCRTPTTSPSAVTQVETSQFAEQKVGNQ